MLNNLSMSGDPRGAAHQALDLAAALSEPVLLTFNGELDGVHHRALIVVVRTGTSVDTVVEALRDEALKPPR